MKKKGADDEDVRILSTEEEKSIESVSMLKRKNGEYLYPGGLHFRFLLATGLRVGEYICLKWEDYDPKNHILSITKSVHQVKADKNDSVETNYLALEGTTKKQ